jgi:hypothetical protein
MQLLNKEAKQERAEFTALFGSSVGPEPEVVVRQKFPLSFYLPSQVYCYQLLSTACMFTVRK